MKIKSISDVITNSSSEVFLVKTDETRKDFKKLLLELKDEGSSGMGGLLDIIDQSLVDKEIDKDWPSICTSYFIPEGFLLVDVDWSKKSLIDFLINYCNVIDVGDSYIERDNTGRVISFSNKTDKEHESGEILDMLQDYQTYKDLDIDKLDINGKKKDIKKYEYEQKKKEAINNYLEWSKIKNIKDY